MLAARLASGALAVLIAGPDLAAEFTPQDFSAGMPVLTPAGAAAYRFSLPVTVYQTVVYDNLSDLRVFNAQDGEVPLVVTLPSATRTAHAGERELPLFPVHGESIVALDSLRVTMGTQGSTLHLQTRDPRSAAAPELRYVLDGRGLDTAITAISVQWPSDALDFAGKLKIEAGETLGVWHTVIDGAPIANLHANGQQLIERRVELPGVRAKFWQLSWVGTAAPFEFTGASVEPALVAEQPARSRVAATGTAVAGQHGEIDFDLGVHAPVERINLELPTVNSVVSAEVLSRRDAQDSWHTVVRGGFYRLQADSQELRNGPIAVATNTSRYWRVRPLQPVNGIGPGIVRLEAQWRAHEVTFLARGGGPFQLAFGSSAATQAGAGFDALPEGIAVVSATLGAAQVLGGEARLQPPTAPFPWRIAVLWAVLGVGVLSLAGMAYRLSRNVGGRAN